MDLYSPCMGCSLTVAPVKSGVEGPMLPKCLDPPKSGMCSWNSGKFVLAFLYAVGSGNQTSCEHFTRPHPQKFHFKHSPWPPQGTPMGPYPGEWDLDFVLPQPQDWCPLSWPITPIPTFPPWSKKSLKLSLEFELVFHSLQQVWTETMCLMEFYFHKWCFYWFFFSEDLCRIDLIHNAIHCNDGAFMDTNSKEEISILHSDAS